MDDAAVAVAAARRAAALLTALRTSRAPNLGPQGDTLANTEIHTVLSTLRPDDPVLSEESPDTPTRLTADRLWIIDPLDGTREYATGSPDWSVHVALWQRGAGITAAAVALPARDEILTTATPATPPTRSDLRIAVSATRPPPTAAPIAAHLNAHLIPMGSAGAKAMAVLRGDVDAYLHEGGQWEWDSAAPVGIAIAAGLHASRADGSPLIYNRPNPYLPDLLICRPDLAEPLLKARRATT